MSDRRDAKTVPPERPKLGLGKLVIPPRPATELPLVAPVHEDTRPGSPAPPYRRTVTPTPWESPTARKRVEEASRRQGDALVEAPVSVSLAPPPVLPLPQRSAPPESVGAIRVQAGGVDVRIGSQPVKKAWPFIVAFAVTTVGGGIVGYYQGLKAAGARVAAVEEQQRLAAELDSRQEVRIEKAEQDLNRAFVVLGDHESRLAPIKREIEAVRGAQPRIQGLPK